MPMILTVSAEERAAVERALGRVNLRPRVRERLEMVKAAALGDDPERIAAWSGRSPRTVARWLQRFAAGGIAALADAARSGRPVRADGAYVQALAAAVATPPASVGLPFDVWTSARLAAYLAERTGVRLAPGWIRALLARHDWACGRPKHTLKHLHDSAAVTACQAELAEVGEKGAGRAGLL